MSTSAPSAPGLRSSGNAEGTAIARQALAEPRPPGGAKRHTRAWQEARERFAAPRAILHHPPNLALEPVFPYVETMEVHFSPDIETRLQQVALAHGKDAEQLVKDTVVRMLENQARFVAGVEKGIAAAGRGELIDHEDVVKRINRLFEP